MNTTLTSVRKEKGVVLVLTALSLIGYSWVWRV